jgi:hypothetical protein
MMTIFPYPPIRSVAASRNLFVGADPDGRWIVRDNHGLVGGLFSDRDAALRFAALESDREDAAVTILPDEMTLGLTGAIPADDEPPFIATAAALLI